mmetsp:Transcript_18349/g.46929  ORF Transcript_18349/g.46929 Transcript_18349/m.46929 type:complete len:227 (+) Transcript_18349:805-1485(+)
MVDVALHVHPVLRRDAVENGGHLLPHVEALQHLLLQVGRDHKAACADGAAVPRGAGGVQLEGARQVGVAAARERGLEQHVILVVLAAQHWRELVVARRVGPAAASAAAARCVTRTARLGAELAHNGVARARVAVRTRLVAHVTSRELRELAVVVDASRGDLDRLTLANALAHAHRVVVADRNLLVAASGGVARRWGVAQVRLLGAGRGQQPRVRRQGRALGARDIL